MAADKPSSSETPTPLPEPRGFGEHVRGLAGEYAHEQGWGLNEEERKATSRTISSPPTEAPTTTTARRTSATPPSTWATSKPSPADRRRTASRNRRGVSIDPAVWNQHASVAGPDGCTIGTVTLYEHPGQVQEQKTTMSQTHTETHARAPARRRQKARRRPRIAAMKDADTHSTWKAPPRTPFPVPDNGSHSPLPRRPPPRRRARRDQAAYQTGNLRAGLQPRRPPSAAHRTSRRASASATKGTTNYSYGYRVLLSSTQTGRAPAANRPGALCTP